MDCAISLRSMAMLRASRTRLSFMGATQPSGPSTNHMCTSASSLRRWMGKPSFSSSFTRSRLISATSSHPRAAEVGHIPLAAPQEGDTGGLLGYQLERDVLVLRRADPPVGVDRGQ